MLTTCTKKGQATVEFAFICLPFFAILFATIDMAQIYFYENAVQNGMREAARFATAGRIIPQLDSNGTPVYTNIQGVSYPVAIPSAYGAGDASRNECIRYWFYSNCILGQNAIPMSNITIVSAPTLPGVPPVTNLITNGPGIGRLRLLSGYNVTTNAATSTVSTNPVPAIVGPGGQDDYIQVTIHYNIPTITPLFNFFGFNRGDGNWNVFPICQSAIVKNEGNYVNFHHTNIYSNEPYDSSW